MVIFRDQDDSSSETSAADFDSEKFQMKPVQRRLSLYV